MYHQPPLQVEHYGKTEHISARPSSPTVPTNDKLTGLDMIYKYVQLMPLL